MYGYLIFRNPYTQGKMATSRHLWVGGLPDGMSEEDIKDYFTRYAVIDWNWNKVFIVQMNHLSIDLVKSRQ